MRLPIWLKRIRRSLGNSKQAKVRYRRPRRLAAEALEDRSLPATLALSIPAISMPETAGNSVEALLNRTGDLSQPLTVNLTSSDTTEATVPATVSFAPEQQQASFSISAVDDGLVDGTQTVEITATANVTQGQDPFGLDLSYGTNGLTAPTALKMAIQPPNAAIAVQPDGKVIVAGEGGGWRLQRFNTDGTLDTTFGGDGLVQTTGIGSFPVPLKAVVIPGGRILVGGKDSGGTGAGILIRYHPNGSLDTTFGNGGIADLSRLTNAWVTDIALRPDGRILLGLGENGSVQSRVAQLNFNGTFDSTFGNLGVAALNLGYTTEHVEILENGDILAGGSFRSPVEVAKIQADGKALVASFGNNGVASLGFGTDGVSVAGMIVDESGRIVLGADVFDFVNGTSTPADFAAGRFLPDGTPDTSFAGDGAAVIARSGSELSNSLVLQQDGKVVVGGRSRTDAGVLDSAMVRFNEDGTPDDTFGSDGVFHQSLVTTYAADQIFNMALQDDGKLLAIAGWHDDIRVARFHLGQQTFTLTASDMIDVLDDDAATGAPVANDDAYTVAEDGVLVVSAPSGPVLRYGFDEASSGTDQALDSGVAPPGNATLVSGATRTASAPGGASRGALDLTVEDSTSTYATAGDVDKIDGLGALTVTVWVNLRSAAQANDVLLSDIPLNSDPGGTGGWDLTLTSFGGAILPVFSVHEKETSSSSRGVGKILTGVDLDQKWAFLALTYNSSQFLNVFNGSETVEVADGGGTGAGIPLRGNNAPLSIGRSSRQTSDFDSTPPAWIDDVRIYDRALTLAELEAVRQEALIPTQGVMDNDSDPDGDPLTAALVDGPSHGSLTFFPDGNFHYLPNANFHGTDTFTYKVSDGALESAPATVTITVTPTNDAPVGAPDSYTTTEDTPLNIAAPGLLGNDTDIDGDTLSFGRIVAQPILGTVSVNSDGSFTYTPLPNFYTVGLGLPGDSDRFFYVATDGQAESAPVSVQIKVNPVNDPPAANDDDVNIAEDSGPVAIDVLANDDLQLDEFGDSNEVLAIVGATQPANGTVAFTATGVTYTPSPNFFGADSFTYTVTDSNDGGVDTATVNITVDPVNDAPVAAGFQFSTDEDTPLNEILRASDVDGDALTFSLVSPPSQGTVQITDASTGAFTYTPPLNFNSPVAVEFDFKVNDGTVDSAPARVFISVRSVNDAPVAMDDSATVAEDAPATTINVHANDSDVDGDTLTIEAVTQPSNGSVAIVGGGTGLTYQPAPNFNGLNTFSYTISDGEGGTATAMVTVTVTPVNDAPVTTSDVKTTLEDHAITFSAADLTANDRPGPLSAVDEANQTLTVIAVQNGTGGSVVLNANGAITFTPNQDFNGQASFTYTVKDNGGRADGGDDDAEGMVTINITPVNDAPIPGPVQQFSAVEDTPVFNLDLDDLLSQILAGAQPGPATATDEAGQTPFILAIHGGGLDDVMHPQQRTDGTSTVQGDRGGTLLMNFTSDQATYRPALNFAGIETFDYTLSDGGGAANGGVETAPSTFTFNVSAVNDAPVANALSVTTDEDTPVSGTVTATDVDGDTLAYSQVAGPAHGTLTVNANGTFTYTPGPNYNGPDSFTFKVNDGTVDSTPATVSIMVTAVPEASPVAIDIKPGDSRNRINPRSHGKIEVAILSTSDFDARRVDVGSLRFGRTGTENSVSLHPKKGPRFDYKDVNGDGRLDLVVRFETELTGFQAGDTKGILTGRLEDGTSFTAEDDISTPPSKRGSEGDGDKEDDDRDDDD